MTTEPYKAHLVFVCVEKPVPREEHNGEGFHYRVGYRPMIDGERMSTSSVMNPSSSELIVYDVPIFQKYEIFVQSVNNIGQADILGGERKMGYSGEGRKLSRIIISPDKQLF